MLMPTAAARPLATRTAESTPPLASGKDGTKPAATAPQSVSPAVAATTTAKHPITPRTRSLTMFSYARTSRGERPYSRDMSRAIPSTGSAPAQAGTSTPATWPASLIAAPARAYWGKCQMMEATSAPTAQATAKPLPAPSPMATKGRRESPMVRPPSTASMRTPISIPTGATHRSS